MTKLDTKRQKRPFVILFSRYEDLLKGWRRIEYIRAIRLFTYIIRQLQLLQLVLYTSSLHT